MDNTTQHPFAPRGPLTSAQLRAYVEGGSDNTARHEVELHMETDPLIREAVEGMQISDAMAGSDALEEARPKVSGSGFGWYLVGGILVLAIIGVIRWSAPANAPQQNAGTLVMSDTTISDLSTTEEVITMTDQEVITAVEIPESLHIGHSKTDRHAEEMRTEVVAREVQHVDRLKNRTPAFDSVQPSGAPPPKHSKKHSLQLMYLHDLKLVDPSELYTTDPILTNGPVHLTADLPDEAAREQRTEQQRFLRYTPFMEVAMAKFSRNDHRGCLEELRFLLAQYPNDVNALFYAGLCCYNLGMYTKAEKFLERAATHSISAFDEEAVWYNALAMERNGKKDSAKVIFQRIAREGGFYAERALERLGK